MSLFTKNKEEKNEKKVNIIQEDPVSAKRLVEETFKELIVDGVTDISFNGVDIYYQDNNKGRLKSNINLSAEEAYSFIRKIANYMLKSFSISSPILDVSFDNYRLNATYPSIARANNTKVITFSIRIIYEKVRITTYDSEVASKDVYDLLDALIKSYQSIIIGGKTGAGKTELQKYLISLMYPSDRIIIIEESYETRIKEIYKQFDITSWIATSEKDLKDFITMALRNNPDWLIVAETRSSNAYQMVKSAMSGHSTISTIHANDASNILDRICKMCIGEYEMDEALFKIDTAEHIKIGIQMERIYDARRGKYVRRICQICEYVPTKNNVLANMLYYIAKNENGLEEENYGTLSKEMLDNFNKNNIDRNKIRRFIK